MKKNLVVLSMVAGLALLAPSRADAWTTQGAEITEKGTFAADVAVGFPLVRGTFHLPILDNFEINPFLEFFYGMGIPNGIPNLGNIVGAQFKLAIFQSEHVDVAFLADVGFMFHYFPNVFDFGLQIGTPAFLATYRLNDKVALSGGLRIPIAFIFTGFYARIPILFDFSAEFAMNEKLNLYARINAGPQIVAAPTFVALNGYVSALFGVAFRF
jgi:hypothetical protein